METNKKDWDKKAEHAKGDLKTGRIPDQHTDEQYRSVGDKSRNDPNPVGEDTRRGTVPKNSAATDSGEETRRNNTTDSSRAPKNDNDERPTGGNVR